MVTKHTKDDSAAPLARRFNLMEFTDDLIHDLDLLRAGKISARDATVRSELARQVLRAIGLVVTAQKFIEGNATVLPPVKDQKK